MRELEDYIMKDTNTNMREYTKVNSQSYLDTKGKMVVFASVFTMPPWKNWGKIIYLF